MCPARGHELHLEMGPLRILLQRQNNNSLVLLTSATRDHRHLFILGMLTNKLEPVGHSHPSLPNGWPEENLSRSDLFRQQIKFLGEKLSIEPRKDKIKCHSRWGQPYSGQ